MNYPIPKVYFTKTIDSKHVLDMFKILGKDLDGPVALKVHSGEAKNINFLQPDLFKDIYDYFSDKQGTIVEANTSYQVARNTTEAHLKLLEEHKWTTTFSRVEILDYDKEKDVQIPVPNKRQIDYNIIGGNTLKYKSMVVLTHFKGHGMGGYGGALKQLSIGCASASGKANIHSAGKCQDPEKWKDYLPEQDEFLRSMADAASSVVSHFNGNMAFINVMKNISIDCDCSWIAQKPCMADVGILSSLDPVAVDTACIDLVINSLDPGKVNLLNRINGLHGYYTIDVAAEKGVGNKVYQLINLD
jgi:uncharacterized Fe-S center protein